VPVATERNSRVVPPRADVPYQASKMGTHLAAARAGSSPCRRRGSAGSSVRHNER
jgi:hypothetical protein